TEFRLQGYHPLWPDFPFRLTIQLPKSSRLFRFRSPLLSESRLISVPRATEMFQFTRFAFTGLCIQPGILPCGSGFPHSDICGSKLVCQLPAAFRRLPRPSSPVIAKASTTCTCSLDPITLPTRGAQTPRIEGQVSVAAILKTIENLDCVCNHIPVFIQITKTEYDIYLRIVKEQPNIPKNDEQAASRAACASTLEYWWR